MTSADALDRVIETILVDCYNEDEAYTAFLTVIQDEVALPTPASLLGTPVTVVELDYTDPAQGLVAVCRAPQGTGEVAFADVAFPADTLAAWHTPPTATTWPQAIPGSPQTRLDLAGRLTGRWSWCVDHQYARRPAAMPSTHDTDRPPTPTPQLALDDQQPG